MKIAAAITLLGLVLGPAPAWAASDDDWELALDPRQELTMAAVRYEGGQAIVAQCQRGRLVVMIAGLPPQEGRLNLTATRTDGRSTSQIWAPVAGPGVFRSASPAREARFMRGGGAYTIRSATEAGAPAIATFDLPAQSANLDRVLTDCGWALQDDRDLLEEADVTLDPPSARSDRPAYRLPSVPEREVSCVVRETRFQDCRADHPPSQRTSNTRSLIRAVQGERAYVPLGADPQSAEGKVFRIIASNQLLVVVSR
jgi:hypothetical protein